MTTALWIFAGAFAYLGVGTTVTTFLCGLSEAARRRRFPDEVIGPTIVLWPATLLVAGVAAVAKTIAAGIRIIRGGSPSAALLAAAEAKGVARERGRVLALIAAEKSSAAQLMASEPLLAEWRKAFDHVALAVADIGRGEAPGRGSAQGSAK